MDNPYAKLVYEANLAAAVKAARCRAVLLMDDNSREEIAMFTAARKLDATGDGGESWVERYQQALDIYNGLIASHDVKQVVAVPQMAEESSL